MAGLIGTGLTYRQQAEALSSKSDELKDRRDQQNEMIKQADIQQKASLTATGALVGASAGAEAGSVGGPWGAVIGAGIGYLAAELF